MPWDESPDKMLQRQAKDQSPFDAEHITGRNRAGIADDPAFIDRPDLFQENNRGTSKGRIAFDEKVRWQTGFLLILACNGSNDQRGGVILFPQLFCRTTTGRIPPCSEPVTGFRSAQ